MRKLTSIFVVRLTGFDRMNLSKEVFESQSLASGSSAQLVRVAVLSVALQAVKGLLGALFSLFLEQVLLFLLAGLDVGGLFRRKE